MRIRTILALIVLISTICSSCLSKNAHYTADISDSLEEENQLLKSQLESLNKDIVDLNTKLDTIEYYLDHNRRIELTDSSLYQLCADYNNSRYVYGIDLSSKNNDFNIDGDSIYDFIVSNDDQYIAVLTYDETVHNSQNLHIYRQSGSKILTYSIDEFFNQVNETQYSKDELIVFDGFSSNNEFLWGSLVNELDCGIHFSINMETGELNVYDSYNYSSYGKLLEKYPIKR